MVLSQFVNPLAAWSVSDLLLRWWRDIGLTARQRAVRVRLRECRAITDRGYRRARDTRHPEGSESKSLRRRATVSADKSSAFKCSSTSVSSSRHFWYSDGKVAVVAACASWSATSRPSPGCILRPQFGGILTFQVASKRTLGIGVWMRPHCLAEARCRRRLLVPRNEKDPAAQNGAQITEGGRWRDRQPLANDVIPSESPNKARTERVHSRSASLRPGKCLPPEIGDRQPSHPDRPPAGLHDPRRRRREPVQHQAAEQSRP